MSESLSAQISRLKKDKNLLKTDLSRANSYISNLQKVISGDTLPEWKIPTGYSPEAGLNRWAWPLYVFLQENSGTVLDANLRNKACAIFYTALRQFIAYSKLGIELPLEVKELDTEHSDHRKLQMMNKEYDPCCICGFTAITAECHIIPKAHAGPDHLDNFVYLCPNHHHLFDKHRLTKEDFSILKDYVNTNKMESAKIYMIEYHEYYQSYFWKGQSIGFA